MNVKKNIKKYQKRIKQRNQSSLLNNSLKTKKWLLANVPKNIKYTTYQQQFHENAKLGKYVNLMENLKSLSLEELKSMLLKNNQSTGGTKGDIVKKIYSRITDGVPMCPQCGEQDLDQFCSKKLYHCGDCHKVIQQSYNSEWIY